MSLALTSNKNNFFGYACEELASFHYTANCFQVYKPVGHHTKSDFLIENVVGQLFKVQVKKAKYIFHKNSGYKYLQVKTDFDLDSRSCNYDYLVVIHDNNLWQIPAALVDVSTISLGSTKYGSKTGHKWETYKQEINFNLI